jgi:hypothetical protein
MEAMGENVKFAIDEVCQGRESTIAVVWHLGEFLYCEFKFKCGLVMIYHILVAEWNGYVIPFTKGCTFCKCSGNEAALLIR